MANPFESSDFFDDGCAQGEDEIREGFLCPICVTDFKTVIRLSQHFTTVHNDDRTTEEPKKLSSQLKGFLGKVKRTLKNDSLDEISVLEVTKDKEPSFYHFWREEQELGSTTDHFEYFRSIRDSRIDRYVIETNKLLIRLDRLLKDAPSDPEKRKQHEKRVVDWVNDTDVRLCPSCAKSFNISRRRHHCRLCGGIMCHNCSQFLEFEYASKLISPTNLQSNDTLFPSRNESSGLSRRGSNSSLMSMVNSAGEPHVRVCVDCKVLLDRRNQLVEDQHSKPILTQIYQRLREYYTESDKLIPIYYRMYNSFCEGECNFKLRDAQELRVKLMKIAETIDVISRKISNLGMQNEPPPNAMQLKLQMNIRLSATQYLRENMLQLPPLPTEEEFQKRQEQRQLEIQRKIEEEKRMALLEAEAAKSHSSSSSPSSRMNSKMAKNASSASFELVSPDTGWGPEFQMNSNSELNSMDPMLVQINIIKNYIKKAREEHKYDEVSMLELNLKELEINYMLQTESE